MHFFLPIKCSHCCVRAVRCGTIFIIENMRVVCIRRGLLRMDSHN
nr:MAG TPA: hypothetical protein [Caudoviricetes sp.]